MGTNHWPTIGQHSASRWPTAGQPLANHWPTIGQPLANRWPTIGYPSSIIHHPSSIIHHPPSIIHHQSSITKNMAMRTPFEPNRLAYGHTKCVSDSMVCTPGGATTFWGDGMPLLVHGTHGHT